MATLIEFLTLLDDRLQDDDAVLSVLERQAMIQEALEDYSRHRPRCEVVDIAGDGTYDYALPSDFLVEFSSIVSVEYPAGNQVPAFLEVGDYGLYQDASTVVLRFYTLSPSSGNTIRMSYTVPHTITGVAATTTPPSTDHNALANRAAAIGCGWLAAHFAQQGDPSLSAQLAEQQTKSEHYQDLADRYDALYKAHMGLATGSGRNGSGSTVAAASRVGQWDTNFFIASGPYTGYAGRLTHRG